MPKYNHEGMGVMEASDLYIIARHFACEDAREDSLKGIVKTDKDVDEETERIYHQLLSKDKKGEQSKW